MQVIDLSHKIEAGMPCYPGTPAPLFREHCSLEEDGFAEQIFSMSTHTGTHVDMPSHIFRNGLSLDAFDIDRFAGRGIVLDVRDVSGGIIDIELLRPSFSLIKACEFLLLSTGWSRYWGTSGYYECYPVLSTEAALWLAGFGLKGFGMDTISVDASDSPDFGVHRILLEQGTLLIENLADLSPLLHRSFIFCGFPLKLLNAEASPLRAVALVDCDGYS